MGQFDNYDNAYRIQQAEKKLAKLEKKRKPDAYAIHMAKNELANAKLFQSCQIFGKTGFFSSESDPNSDVMFSDDNQVLWFGGRIVPYKDIIQAGMSENYVDKVYTTSKKKGTITRAVVGGIVAGGVGAIVGAATAGSVSKSETRRVQDGCVYQIFLNNGHIYSMEIPTSRPSKRWQMLDQKIQMIIAQYSKTDHRLETDKK